MSQVDKALANEDKMKNEQFTTQYVDNFTSNEPIPSVEEESQIWKMVVPNLPLEVINSYAKQLVCQSDTNLVSMVLMREAEGAVYPTEKELADIVKQSRALCQRAVDAELVRDHAGQQRDLNRMVEHILPVARTESQPSEELYHLRRQPVDTDLVGSSLARLLDHRVDLAASLLYRLLDARRMDAPVGDQLFQRDSRNLAANRVKRGDDHGLRRIVDDQIHARRGFQRADVAALAADYATLHVVVRQCHDRYGGFGHMIGGALLYRERYYVACLLVGLFLGVGFDLAHHYGGVVIRLLLHAVHDYVARFFAGHAGYALQLALLLVVQRLRLGFEPGDVLLLVVQRAFAAFDCLGLFVQRVLALNQTAVGALQLVAAVAYLLLLRHNGSLSCDLYIPFWNVTFQINWIVYLFFAVLVIVGCVNAVNLTDGIDGLVAATLIAGVLLVVMGLLKLGTIIRFVPYTITTGFTAGIAVTIVIGQLKDFFGLTYPAGTATVETADKV